MLSLFVAVFTPNFSGENVGNAKFHFLTGVARETEKVIDYKVYSKFCKSCALQESKKGTEKYIVSKENHGKDCEINHFQSSGTMESGGAQSFFQSSVNKYNIRYAHYIGDCNTESFKKVLESKPYYGHDLIPCKL